MQNMIKGLIAAAFSPMHEDGSLHVELIPRMVEYLLQRPIQGLYVCGSTGEGPLLSVEERKRVAAAYINAVKKQIPVFVHVGHDSLMEARSLASHAAQAGADAIAAVGPCYFKPGSLGGLIKYLAEIAAAAPETDFYYYHIPQLSGNVFDVMEFLKQAPQRIPTLRGVKYSAITVYEFQDCKETFGDRYQLFFGCDEMLTSGLAAGADAAIGSTYNFLSRLYHQVMEAFTKGDVQTARRLQLLSVRMVRVCYQYRGLPAIKAMMKMTGLDCGPTRLPLEALSIEEYSKFKSQIESLGVCEWF
ncbi:MAG TPA: dihydrodipicolinate synthase family protein [Anaerohalosphaeraceae bacterium]|nr:dihydrodipicolinate synthase family protein [Anaerohalosphaeraceae bacterium]